MTGLGALWLSEFAGSKDRHQIEDDGGDRSDWIEIYNRGSDTVALGGHFLTDTLDDLDQWKFPDIQVEPDGYLLIFASGKDRRTGTLHANFKLSSEGEFIALVRPDGKTIVHSVSPPFPTKPTTKSFGLGHSKNTVVAFDKATPGKPNANPSLPEPTFSEKRGFYDDAFELRITSDKQIRYTLDGASPSEHAGLIYHAPIPIKATTILRAAAFDPLGAQTPSNTVTHTYIFPRDTIKQRSVPPSGWPDPQPNPQSKKAQAYAYGMLPSAEIEATDDELRRAMRAIPSISLVTDLAHWFDPNSGIYCNGQGRGREWERPVSAEL
ncbi:MAG: FN3 associated domain-containing protein, partial [Verrucomicrobiales bacterium]